MSAMPTLNRAPNASAEDSLAGSSKEQKYRALEREWQNGVGYELLDKPYEAAGSETLFNKQWDQLVADVDRAQAGPLIEIGCGKGHFLRRFRAVSRHPYRPLVGMDVARAVFTLPPQGFPGVQADAELMPFRSESVACVIYTGSLHHMIDYVGSLRESVRVLAPGGLLVVYEPTITWFSQLAHRLLDPIVFRKVVYESPIDIEYKKDFQFEKIVNVLREANMDFEMRKSDFLAYPFTGCYASSVFSRSVRFMRLLMAIEEKVESISFLRSLALTFAWRVTIVARKGRSS